MRFLILMEAPLILRTSDMIWSFGSNLLILLDIKMGIDL